MLYIVIALMVLVVALAARFVFLRREIDRISRNLKELNIGASRQKLTVNTLHSSLENLCRQINAEMEVVNDAKKHEAELRAQISNISHDLRTPLTAILGYISMAKAAPQKREDYLEIIESRSKALQSLVEQFYELSVIEDTLTELVLEAIDITAMLTNCLLGHYALFEKKGIEPDANVSDRRIFVISNAGALERIFQNLLQNALKFAARSITLSLEDKDTYCVFTISNDAPGLHEADVKHLFERFYTADKSRIGGNTGLGLYIVKRLLEKTQGSVGNVTFVNGWFSLEIIFAKQR